MKPVDKNNNKKKTIKHNHKFNITDKYAINK